MPSINTDDNFKGRVAYAASVISSGRRTSRAFDNCFEHHDGDEVLAIIFRRAEKNLKLADNLAKYFDVTIAQEHVDKLAGISTRDMPAHAAETRARCRREFDEFMKEVARNQAVKEKTPEICHAVEPAV